MQWSHKYEVKITKKRKLLQNSNSHQHCMEKFVRWRKTLAAGFFVSPPIIRLHCLNRAHHKEINIIKEYLFNQLSPRGMSPHDDEWMQVEYNFFDDDATMRDRVLIFFCYFGELKSEPKEELQERICINSFHRETADEVTRRCLKQSFIHISPTTFKFFSPLIPFLSSVFRMDFNFRIETYKTFRKGEKSWYNTCKMPLSILWAINSNDKLEQ